MVIAQLLSTSYSSLSVSLVLCFPKPATRQDPNRPIGDICTSQFPDIKCPVRGLTTFSLEPLKLVINEPDCLKFTLSNPELACHY
jgi:hypothetical protein